MPLSRTFAGLAAVALTASVALAGGHDMSPEQKIVKARQAHMQLYAHNLGILGAMAKGAVGYDAGAASAAAGNLVALAGMNQASLWVEETDSMMIDGSRAMATLWDNMPDAMAKGAALGEALTAMNAAAGSGLEALQGAIGPVGKACGDCHKAYREPN
ncbi:MAG: c-type cytochrome [Brevirhabdus sp.]